MVCQSSNAVFALPQATREMLKTLRAPSDRRLQNRGRSFDSILVGGPGIFAEIFVENVVGVSGNRFYFHPLAGEFGYFDQQPLP